MTRFASRGKLQPSDRHCVCVDFTAFVLALTRNLTFSEHNCSTRKMRRDDKHGEGNEGKTHRGVVRLRTAHDHTHQHRLFEFSTISWDFTIIVSSRQTNTHTHKDSEEVFRVFAPETLLVDCRVLSSEGLHPWKKGKFGN